MFKFVFCNIANEGQSMTLFRFRIPRVLLDEFLIGTGPLNVPLGDVDAWARANLSSSGCFFFACCFDTTGSV